MIRPLSPPAATLAAAGALGLALGASFFEVLTWVGPAPGALLTTICACGAFCVFGPSRRGAWRAPILAAVGGTAVLAGLSLMQPGPWLESIAPVLPAAVGAWGGLLARPTTRALRTAGPIHALVVAPGFLVGLSCPGLATAFLGFAALVSAVRAPSPFDNFGARRLELRPGRAFGAALGIAAAVATLLLLRARLMPTPAAVVAGAEGALLGGLLAGTPVRGVAIILASCAGVAVSLFGGLDTGPTLVFLLLGSAAGACWRVWRAGDLAAFSPVLGVFLGSLAPASLPVDWQIFGATSVATLPRSGPVHDRVTEIRKGVPTLSTWTGFGPTLAWGTSGLDLVEMDGAVAGSSGRARTTERFAGVLAGCAAQNHGVARVVGDDFGRVTTTLLEQGFGRVDAAVLSPALAERVADADPAARRAWLGSGVRLLVLPGNLLLEAAGAADALVQVLRVGWSDARTAWPTRWTLRARAARVAAGGVDVLVLPGVGVEPSILGGTIRAFAEQWPTVSLVVPPEGAESLLLVGSAAPLPWSSLSTCVSASPWLRSVGIAAPLDLASLVVGDRAFASSLAGNAGPSLMLPAALNGLPLLPLLEHSSITEASFSGAVPAELVSRQATRRAALGVLQASDQGDIQGALRSARALASEPGAGGAIDPMILPILDRARAAARSARAEGPDSSHWDEAEADVEAALLMNPASALARCLRGDIAMARRRSDEALRWYQECADHDPKLLAAWEGLARAKQLGGDDPGAEAALRTATRVAPEAWTASLNLGVLLNHRGQMEEAEKWLRKAEDQASSSTEPGRSRAHLALAMLYLQTSRAELALAEAGRAEVDEPSEDSAFWTGAARYELKAWTEAEAAYRLALQRRSTMVEAQNGLGLCLARRGDYAGAAAAFRAVLAVDSGNRMAQEKLDLLRPLLEHEDAAVRGAAPVPGR